MEDNGTCYHIAKGGRGEGSRVLGGGPSDTGPLKSGKSHKGQIRLLPTTDCGLMDLGHRVALGSSHSARWPHASPTRRPPAISIQRLPVSMVIEWARCAASFTLVLPDCFCWFRVGISLVDCWPFSISCSCKKYREIGFNRWENGHGALRLARSNQRPNGNR